MAIASSPRHRAWSSSLPSDLLALFLDRLSFADLVAFGAVCPSWRSAAKSHPHSLALRLPWLVLPRDPPAADWGFSSLAEPGLHHRLPIPAALPLAAVRFFGSSFGWLLMAGDDLSNHLLNPFTKKHFQLPNSVASHGYKHPRRAILLSIPSDQNLESGNCVVVAIDARQDLAFCRPGDNEWTVFENNLFDDIIFFDGLLYGLVTGQHIRVYEFGPQPACRESYNLQHILVADPDSDGDTRYLVESPGEILLVLRFWAIDFPVTDDGVQDFDASFVRTMRFVVYKLDRSGPNWVQVRDLGDQMLVVGNGYSKSFAAVDHTFYEANNIYFTDDNFDNLTFDNNDLCPDYDWGVFCLADESIHPFLLNGYRALKCPPFWYMLNV